MVFPATPLERMVELNLNGTWTDVTAYVYERDKVSVSRGRSDESSSATPASARFTLNNRDGRFSPRNPTGPYYGLIGRNTPVRISAKAGSTRLVIAAAATDFASAPDTAGLSVTGDIDLRADLRLRGVNTTTPARLIRKYTPVGQQSYSFYLDATHSLVLGWSTNGTSDFAVSSTVPLPRTTGRIALRVTFDVDNGASGRTTTFYYADTIGGTWTQLGDPVVQAGVTSIFDGTAVVSIGNDAIGDFYAAEIRNGIAGSVVGSPIFTSQADGATSFADAQGNTWTLNGTAALTTGRYRFYGEVSAWPQAWEISGQDVWTTVEAAGVMRRLGQGADPLKGSIQRFVLRNASPAYAYWPMEDESSSTSIASGLNAGPPMSIAGTPSLASDSTFISSNPLPVLANGSFSGAVIPYTATGTIYAQMLLDTPTAGEPVSGTLLRIYTTGTAQRWDVDYDQTVRQLRLRAYDSGGVSLLNQLSSSPDGKPLSLIVNLFQNGANVDWGFYLNGYVNPTPGLSSLSNTIVGYTVGAATYVQVNPDGALSTSTVGHLYVFGAPQNGTPAEIKALRGGVGETAGRRIERLCGEEGIAFAGYGDLDESVLMGPQRALPLLDLLGECETADMGQLFEPRDFLGLAYRTRDSRQYQQTSLALSYGNLSELNPVEDDQRTRNDVTVTRTFGSSVRDTLDVGPLSTLAPPNGVGRYTDAVEVNLYTDSQLADQAQWRLTAGTIDEARYPNILARLETAAFAASSSLTSDALSVDIGDLLTVSGLPAWLPPDTVRQHTVGSSEVLGAYEYGITYVCAPITPAGATGLWDVSGRWSPDGSTLTSTITSSATSFQITTPANKPLWTTNVADFPLDVVIAGERITLSSISGTSSPQTAAVSARSVNGVVKTQTAGAAIDIYDQTYYGF